MGCRPERIASQPVVTPGVPLPALWTGLVTIMVSAQEKDW
jgi:hypothetical protein